MRQRHRYAKTNYVVSADRYKYKVRRHIQMYYDTINNTIQSKPTSFAVLFKKLFKRR